MKPSIYLPARLWQSLRAHVPASAGHVGRMRAWRLLLIGLVAPLGYMDHAARGWALWQVCGGSHIGAAVDIVE